MPTVETAETTHSPNVAPRRSMATNLISVIGLVLSGIYLANPSPGGIVEFIPDIIPGIGNLDEFIATTIFLTCLSRLGINVLPQSNPRKTVVQSYEVKD